MKKLFLIVAVLFPMVSMAGTEICVQMKKHEPRLCAKIIGYQDSSMSHLAMGVTDFKYEDGSTWIPLMRYTARGICKSFINEAYPGTHHIRPDMPFGMSKEASEIRVMYSNGNCTTKKVLKTVGCYTDIK